MGSSSLIAPSRISIITEPRPLSGGFIHRVSDSGSAVSPEYFDA